MIYIIIVTSLNIRIDKNPTVCHTEVIRLKIKKRKRKLATVTIFSKLYGERTDQRTVRTLLAVTFAGYGRRTQGNFQSYSGLNACMNFCEKETTNKENSQYTLDSVLNLAKDSHVKK